MNFIQRWVRWRAIATSLPNKGKVYRSDYEGKSEELVGKFELKLMLLQLAAKYKYDIIEVLDMDEYTFRIGDDIYDFENLILKEDVSMFYIEEILNDDICIITRFEIAAGHRGKVLLKR